MTDLPPITLPAELLVPAWRNAFLAADDTNPALTMWRSVLIEWHSRGLRFVATDSHVVVASWAADDREATTHTAPDHDEAPTGTVVAIAADRIMTDFLKHRASEVKAYYRALDDESAEPVEPVDITISIGTIDQPDTAQQRLDLGAPEQHLILSTPTERIALPLHHGRYPEWRNTLAGAKPSPRALVQVRRDLLRRIGQLDSLPYLDDDAWLRLTMANAGEMVLVAGVGRVPVEGAFVLRREEAAEVAA